MSNVKLDHGTDDFTHTFCNSKHLIQQKTLCCFGNCLLIENQTNGAVSVPCTVQTSKEPSNCAHSFLPILNHRQLFITFCGYSCMPRLKVGQAATNLCYALRRVCASLFLGIHLGCGRIAVYK